MKNLIAFAILLSITATVQAGTPAPTPKQTTPASAPVAVETEAEKDARVRREYDEGVARARGELDEYLKKEGERIREENERKRMERNYGFRSSECEPISSYQLQKMQNVIDENMNVCRQDRGRIRNGDMQFQCDLPQGTSYLVYFTRENCRIVAMMKSNRTGTEKMSLPSGYFD